MFSLMEALPLKDYIHIKSDLNSKIVFFKLSIMWSKMRNFVILFLPHANYRSEITVRVYTRANDVFVVQFLLVVASFLKLHRFYLYRF